LKNNKTILITGGNSQLSHAFIKLKDKYLYKIISLNHKELDITNPYSIDDAIQKFKPYIIINTAAYNDVDKAENDIDNVYKVNVVGVKNIALACLSHNIKMVHYSTDYVFDGKKKEPYTELDKTNPLSVYGKSKLAGENILKFICPKHFIIRTSWLFGNGNNFVQSILKIIRNGKIHLKVVNDQIGSPTYTEDLARVTFDIIETDLYGIYHMSNNGECSWYDFAKEIIKIMGLSIDIESIKTEDLNQIAIRPKYSTLKNQILEQTIGDNFRQWDDALEEYLFNYIII